ncbi:Copia protein [Gossypium australe]|uniref:Copia protein n=1 Tax=Gossypium australe TaxID=47621 RepID=A0A5B6WYI3_9ROSI|nr:Copia protein [Gossypium australe]
MVNDICYISTFELKKVEQALQDEHWFNSMQDETSKRFINPHKQGHVYKLSKAPYKLKQAPKAWYEQLFTFCSRRVTNRTIWKKNFLKKGQKSTTIVLIYVDNIIFGSTIEKDMVKRCNLEQAENAKTPMCS